MRLRDEQNREMIINLMAGKRNASTPGKNRITSRSVHAVGFYTF